jgi:hypothetical protein
MKITINIIPHSQMRYDTLDDWQMDGDNIVFQIVDTGNNLYTKIVLVHALVEQLLTEAKGISEEEITRFDVDHPDSLEPGLEQNAPYRSEHLLAEGIERLICAYLNIPWREYNQGGCNE